MSAQAVDVVLYSADPARREAVKRGIGIRPGKGAPTLQWIETATAQGTIRAVEAHRPPIVILDAEAPKVGGMAVAQDIHNQLEQDPVIILLTARPQDRWLATWAGAAYTVLAPYDPLELQRTMMDALRTI